MGSIKGEGWRHYFLNREKGREREICQMKLSLIADEMNQIGEGSENVYRWYYSLHV